MRTAALLLLGALSGACASPRATATPPPSPTSGPAAVRRASLRGLTVGVAPFVVECQGPAGSCAAGTAPSGSAIAEDLATAMAAVAGVRLVEVRQLDRVLEELRLQSTGLVDDRQLARAGEMLGAHLMVVGSVIVRGDQFRLNARLIRVETNEALRAVVRTGPGAELFRLEDEVARALTADLSGSEP